MKANLLSAIIVLGTILIGVSLLTPLCLSPRLWLVVAYSALAGIVLLIVGILIMQLTHRK